MEGFKSIALLLNCPDFSQALGQKGVELDGIAVSD